MHPEHAKALKVTEGWLELGDLDEAWSCFVKIPPKERIGPDALILWVRMYSAQREWAEAARIGRMGLQTYPACSYLYVRTAHAVARCESLAAAQALLLEAEHLLKGNGVWELQVAYYDSQLGNHDASVERLHRLNDTNPDFVRTSLHKAEDWF